MTDRTPAETFAHLIRLHLDNDEGTYNERREIVRDAMETAQPNAMAVDAVGDEKALAMAQRADVADALKEFVEDLAFGADWETNDVSLLAMDLLGAAISYVDWFDMADDFIAEAREEV